MPYSCDVKIQVFDVSGRLIKTLVNKVEDKGFYKVWWDGRDEDGRFMGSGVYFVRMATREFVETRKVILLR